MAGIGIYAVLRPLLGHIPLLGYRFFDATITPGDWGYVGAVLAVPAAAAVACLVSLRRVQISPLGVTRGKSLRQHPVPGVRCRWSSVWPFS